MVHTLYSAPSAWGVPKSPIRLVTNTTKIYKLVIETAHRLLRNLRCDRENVRQRNSRDPLVWLWTPMVHGRNRAHEIKRQTSSPIIEAGNFVMLQYGIHYRMQC